MSWDSYIKMLTDSEYVAEAAIWGSSPGEVSMWASSPGLTGITAEEVKKLSGDRSGFYQTGLYIAGQKCLMIRDQLDVDGSYSLDLKTTGDAEGNKYSVCVGKSNKAFVFAKGAKDAPGGQVSTKVYNVVSYLRQSGY